MLAHELRNPLAPIRNAAQLLKDPSAGPEAFEVACRAIDRQSAQLARIVDDLLDNVDAASTWRWCTTVRLRCVAELAHRCSRRWQAAEAYRPEVILLDLGMPGMNGFEVARSLRERGVTPAPRIVAITDLIKPVEQSQIRQALRLRGPRPTRH